MIRAGLTVIGFGLLSLATAVAAPPGPNAPKVSAEVQKKYKAALSRGRKLEKGKDYKGAVTAFQAALAAIPDDPWALSELGWAAYLAKDLTLAEQTTRRAVAANDEPRRKAASLYNLGMIEEALGHKPAAVKALLESLRIRPTVAARGELSKIDPGAAAAIDPFAPRQMEGPFKSLADYCKTRSNPDRGDLECDWEHPEWDAAKAKVALEPPYQAARVFETSLDNEPDTSDENLALKLKSGWYVAPDVGMRNRGGRCENKFEVKGLHFENGKRWLVLEVGQSSECWHNYEDVHSKSTTTWITIVAIGPSGAPSATPRLTIQDYLKGEDEDQIDPGEKVTVDVKLQVKFGDGVIEVSGKADKTDAREVIGTHPLMFP